MKTSLAALRSGLSRATTDPVGFDLFPQGKQECHWPMKDKLCGRVMTEFNALRPKLYT